MKGLRRVAGCSEPERRRWRVAGPRPAGWPGLAAERTKSRQANRQRFAPAPPLAGATPPKYPFHRFLEQNMVNVLGLR